MKKILAALLVVVTALTVTGCQNSEQPSEVVVTDQTRDMTTMEIVRDMGYGINLGNTLEACGDWINSDLVSSYERAWGSPVITQEMIQGYADAGFGVLRIPVAWSNMMVADGTYTINPQYAARVKEVVDWALARLFKLTRI